jgi:rubrerythrin
MAKSAIDILKEAILLERRGKAFYTTAAAQTKSEAAKKIFTMMAEEEEDHIQFLSKQFSHYQKTSNFLQAENHTEDPHEDIAMQVLSDQIVKQVNAASFEAAAISSAIDFESRAVRIYSERAEKATDPNERDTYQMLADWEKGHHKWLHKIDEELREQVWFDNKFWPF